MICKQCGHFIEEGAVKCHDCGAYVEGAKTDQKTFPVALVGIILGALLIVVALIYGIRYLYQKQFVEPGFMYITTEKYTSVVNFRERPDASGAKIDQLGYGIRVEVLDGNKKKQEFYRVEYNGIMGYISRNYLSPSNPDSLFNLKQRAYPSIQMPTIFSGTIGKNSKIEIQIQQYDNYLDGIALIEWRKSNRTRELISKTTETIRGRLDFSNRLLELGEPRTPYTGRMELVLSENHTNLQGSYIKYEGGTTFPVTMTAKH